MGNNKIIGAKIQRIRESKNLTVQEVAERSGLSVDQVERIEGSLDFPSLAPLIKIARVLGVRLGTFLDDQTELGPGYLSETRQQYRHRKYKLLKQCHQSTQAHGIPFLVESKVGTTHGAVPDRYCLVIGRRFYPFHTRRRRIYLCS